MITQQGSSHIRYLHRTHVKTTRNRRVQDVHTADTGHLQIVSQLPHSKYNCDDRTNKCCMATKTREICDQEYLLIINSATVIFIWFSTFLIFVISPKNTLLCEPRRFASFLLAMFSIAEEGALCLLKPLCMRMYIALLLCYLHFTKQEYSRNRRRRWSDTVFFTLEHYVPQFFFISLFHIAAYKRAMLRGLSGFNMNAFIFTGFTCILHILFDYEALTAFVEAARRNALPSCAAGPLFKKKKNASP